MRDRGQLLLTFLKNTNEESLKVGLRFVLCGGLAIHILRDHYRSGTSRPWKHKDIDLQVPLSDLPSAVAFFKSKRFVNVLVPRKKARLVGDYYRLVGTYEGCKILIDIYGVDRIAAIEIPWESAKFLVISPSVELGNWIDRKKRQGSTPSIELTIEFLESIVRRGDYVESTIR